jgi:hypothetical protein
MKVDDGEPDASTACVYVPCAYQCIVISMISMWTDRRYRPREAVAISGYGEKARRSM